MSDPRPSASAALLSELAEYRAQAGSPTISRIAEEMAWLGAPTTRVRLYDFLNGSTLPEDLDFVTAYVRACQRIGRLPDDPGRLRRLQDGWASARQEAAGQPVAPRPAPEAEQGVQTTMTQQGRGYAYVVDGEVVLGHKEASIGTEAENPIDDTRQYLSDLENEIRITARSARRRLNTYHVLRFLVVAASAVTPVLALLKAPALATAAGAAVAFLAEGFVQLTRINDRAILDSRRVQRLSREFRLYRMRVDSYAGVDGFKQLVMRIEEVRERNDNEQLRVIRQGFGSHDTLPDESELLPAEISSKTPLPAPAEVAASET